MNARRFPEFPDPIAPAAAGLVVLAPAAPWLLGFSASHAAVANGIAFLMAFSPLALMAPALRPAAAVCLVAGAWLAVSPWALGYWSQGVAAWVADLILGVALAAASWRALSMGSRSTMKRG
jgi:SPW repeat-containing protein